MKRWNRDSLAAALRNGLTALALVAAVPAAANAQTASPTPLAAPKAAAVDRSGGEMVVPLNKSQVLQLTRPYGQLSIGNPKIADVVPLSSRSVYVLGKEIGTTNLTIYDRDRQPLSVVDVIVGYDVDGLKNRLHEVLPNERIEVRAGTDSVLLSGSLSSPQQIARVMSIAERYAPGKVTNLLSVRGSQQVMLEVKVAEVQRTLARELGLKPTITSGDFIYGTIDNAIFNNIDLTRFGFANLVVEASDFTVSMLIDALEQKGAVKVLAEPNLICLSGDTANFLAGGEFPVPVSRNSDSATDTITIEFKQFGVSLGFTPTVLDDGVINLAVAPEVSQLDRNASLVLNGFTIPGLSTRRASTTVELRDGQSFAIAGLLQADFNDQVRQLPGIGDIPVLGALFRSSQFQNRETELVITVTPHLVKPAKADALALPTDYFTAPSATDLFLLGKIEGDPARRALGNQSGGGLDGSYGHILR